jgi:hypothetical protein
MTRPQTTETCLPVISTSWIRLPQVSSKIAIGTGPASIGSSRSTTTGSAF